MNCPQCGARLPNGHKQCYLCYAPLTGGMPQGQAPVPQSPPAAGPPQLEFTLGPSVSAQAPPRTQPGPSYPGYTQSGFPSAAPPLQPYAQMPAQNLQSPGKPHKSNTLALSAGGVGLTLLWICVRIALRVWAHEATTDRNEQALKPFNSGVTAQNLGGSQYQPNDIAREQLRKMQSGHNSSDFAPPPQFSSHMIQMPQTPTMHGPPNLMNGMPGGFPDGINHGPIGPPQGMIHGPTMSHGPIMPHGPMMSNGPLPPTGPESDN
jgi:hypothetical protein